MSWRFKVAETPISDIYLSIYVIYLNPYSYVIILIRCRKRKIPGHWSGPGIKCRQTWVVHPLYLFPYRSNRSISKLREVD